MKTFLRMIIATVVVILIGSMSGSSAHARGGHGGHGARVGIGVWLGPGWWPGWWGPAYYPSYYYPYYQEPPVVIQEQPDVYIPPTPQEQQPIFWYYCKEPQGYYPYVKQCPSGWMKVVPTPPNPATPAPE